MAIWKNLHVDPKRDLQKVLACAYTRHTLPRRPVSSSNPLSQKMQQQQAMAASAARLHVRCTAQCTQLRSIMVKKPPYVCLATSE